MAGSASHSHGKKNEAAMGELEGKWLFDRTSPRFIFDLDRRTNHSTLHSASAENDNHEEVFSGSL